MAVQAISTLTSELQTTTEWGFTIYEYVTTMNPLDFKTVDKDSEINTDGLDGTYVFYGLGGILIFFVVYILLYSYCLYCKGVLERQETELRDINERAARRPIRHSLIRNRFLVDNFNQTGSTGLTMPTQAESSFTERKTEYLKVNEEKREDTQLDLGKISDNGQESGEKYMPEDNQCLNTTVREVSETSSEIYRSAQNSKTLGRVESWMSEPPLSFSTPQGSNERIFFPEDFQDLLCPATTQMKKCESSDERKSDTDNVTPTKDEPPSTPTPEGKNNSSPSTDIVRRRLTKAEDTPHLHGRPSSWQ